MKRATASFFGAMWVCGVLLLGAGAPGTSHADIYRWEDDVGVVHFTDNPSNIPAKYRNRRKLIQQGPSEPGRPSVSTIGAPPPPQYSPPASAVPPSPQPQASKPEDRSVEAEELRARIAAKEQFMGEIDRKRSNILNPLGNRFVSPEDLELYRKYSEELPLERERLRGIEASAR